MSINLKGIYHNNNNNGGVVEDVISRVNEGARVSGALIRIGKVRSFSVGAKRMMYERILVPTVIYGAEAWWLKEREKRRLNEFEMKFFKDDVWCNSHGQDKE